MPSSERCARARPNGKKPSSSFRKNRAGSGMPNRDRSRVGLSRHELRHLPRSRLAREVGQRPLVVRRLRLWE
jgi:hypothetical protein